MSVSTLRSMVSMVSNSGCPLISGGATWTTGSPRSSVRQYSPASKSAADTWPSSRARSSSVKVCLVAWSLTSSMPKKYPSPRMSPTMGRSYSFSRVARSAGEFRLT
ncbi:Uncharacterised protein [Mycobacterium tuberculosis]|nr:Uncharacterised protein [Mycobacterium tuberculosis]